MPKGATPNAGLLIRGGRNIAHLPHLVYWPRTGHTTREVLGKIMMTVWLLQSRFDLPQWVALCIGAMAVSYLMLRSRRRKDPLQKPPALSLSQQRSVERDMSNLLVELSDMARQISGQLDNRAARLELLIKEADEKIAAMQSIVAAPAGDHPAQIAAPAVTIEEMPDPRHAEIYRLSDQGRSAHEIASQLGRPSGEVELILALRPKS